MYKWPTEVKVRDKKRIKKSESKKKTKKENKVFCLGSFHGVRDYKFRSP